MSTVQNLFSSYSLRLLPTAPKLAAAGVGGVTIPVNNMAPTTSK